MKTYAYQAIDAEGKKQRGRMDALDPSDLEMRLKKFDLDLISSKLSARAQHRIFFFYHGFYHLGWFCHNLSMLICLAVPIRQALTMLMGLTPSNTLKEMTTNLLEGIYAGQSLTTAFQKSSDIFSPVFIGMIHIGEHTENIAKTFERLAQYAQDLDHFTRVRRYLWLVPALLWATFLALAITFVAFCCEALIHHVAWLYGLLVFLFLSFTTFAAILVFYVLKKEPVVRWIDWIDVHWKAQKKLLSLHFLTSFAMLYRAGTQPVEAIELASKAISNKLIKKDLDIVRGKILRGIPLEAALMQSQLFDDGLIHLIAQGRSHGNIIGLLEMACDILNQRLLKQTIHIKRLFIALFLISFTLLISSLIKSAILPI